MKILKVYDKINRNVFHSDTNTGDITIREFYGENNYFSIIINTKILKKETDKIAYFSYVNVVNGNIRETLNITSKYVFFTIMNENGKDVHSERIHLKDNKSILVIDKIYDELGEFIELENHRGIKTIRYKIKNEIINELLKTKKHGRE